MYSYTIFIMLLPLLSFLVLGLAGMKMQHKTAGLIGTCSLGIVTILSYTTAFQYFTAERVNGAFQTIVPYNYTWLPLGNLHFDMGILLDPISVMMLIVISTVSLMVHIYSFGYMHGEKGFQRYYAFLSLFSMSMLGLVLATNIFQMYMFWELVGVSSYLLIGFYYPLKPAIAASKKAFIVTRFADMFFLIGILMFGFFTDTFSFNFAGHGSQVIMGEGTTPFIVGDISRAVATSGLILPTALTLMFIGGAGKSAMFPLHIWLPDDDGGSRCVPDCPYIPLVDRLCPPCVEHRGVGRCLHRFLCRCRGLRPERHQACAGLLYHLSDCLHDGGSRCVNARP